MTQTVQALEVLVVRNVFYLKKDTTAYHCDTLVINTAKNSIDGFKEGISTFNINTEGRRVIFSDIPNKFFGGAITVGKDTYQIMKRNPHQDLQQEIKTFENRYSLIKFFYHPVSS